MVKFPGEVMSSSAAIAAITGILVFVGGQLVVKSMIESYIEFRKQLGKTPNLPLANQAKLANPRIVEMSEVIHELKDAAVQLTSEHSASPFYIKKSHIGFRFVPSTPEITSSVQKLDLIASMYEGKSKESTYEHIAEIRRMLRTSTTYSL